MSEEEARDWVRAHFGGEAVARLGHFAELLASAAQEQNLVARSTLGVVWTRHLTDSAQLAHLDLGTSGLWLDIGTGGGMPGLVLALLLDRPFLLCEPRRLRAEFLASCLETLGVQSRVIVATRKVETLRVEAATISARAVAPIDNLLTAARPCASAETTWILPRGKSGTDEIQASGLLGQGEFHVKQSVTDPDAVVIVARGIGRR